MYNTMHIAHQEYILYAVQWVQFIQEESMQCTQLIQEYTLNTIYRWIYTTQCIYKNI